MCVADFDEGHCILNAVDYMAGSHLLVICRRDFSLLLQEALRGDGFLVFHVHGIHGEDGNETDDSGAGS